MRAVFVGFLIFVAAGCGGQSTPSAVATAVAVDAPVETVTEPMTEDEVNYCQVTGRIQVEEAIRANVPEWQGTAAIMSGTQQFVLNPDGNELAATHLIVCRVQLYRESGNNSIQIWGVYCRGGEPIGAKNLFLGQYPA